MNLSLHEKSVISQSFESVQDSGKPLFDRDLVEHFETWRKNGPACLVSSNPFIRKVLTGYFVSHYVEVATVGAVMLDRCFNQFIGNNWGILVLCIDDFDGLGPVFDKLRLFRNEYPHIPVIITSSDFKSNDYSQERLPICDLSLRLPLDPSSFDELFISAWHNNLAWIQRVSEFSNLVPSGGARSRLKRGMALAWWQGLSQEEEDYWNSKVFPHIGPGHCPSERVGNAAALTAYEIFLRDQGHDAANE